MSVLCEVKESKEYFMLRSKFFVDKMLRGMSKHIGMLTAISVDAMVYLKQNNVCQLQSISYDVSAFSIFKRA